MLDPEKRGSGIFSKDKMLSLSQKEAIFANLSSIGRFRSFLFGDRGNFWEGNRWGNV